MLEIANKNNLDLGVYAVSCVPHKPICRKNNVSGYPRVKVFLDGETEGIDIPHSNVHPFLVLKAIGVNGADHLEEMQEDEYEGPAGTKSDSAAALLGSGSAFWIPRTKAEIYDDAYLSFDFAMRQSIFVGQGGLSKKGKRAFVNWIGLLEEVLPPTWRLQSMVAEINKNIKSVMRGEDKLLEIVNKYPPRKKTWSKSCSRGQPGMGYTCGLWQLFHIMTSKYNIK
jgi:hypothetical protein